MASLLFLSLALLFIALPPSYGRVSINDIPWYYIIREDPRAIWCDESTSPYSLESMLQDASTEMSLTYPRRSSMTLPNNLLKEHYHNFTQFCASTPYGGLPLSNMGAMCDRSTPAHIEVGFALDVGDHRLYDEPIFQTACRTRCHCFTKDEREEALLANTLPKIIQKIPIVVGIRNSVRNKENLKRTGHPKNLGTLFMHRDFFDPNEIWCHKITGPAALSMIPTFIGIAFHNKLLPANIDPFAYHNFTSLCAAVPFGGLPEANMGGHCKRPIRRSEYHPSALRFWPMQGMGSYTSTFGRQVSSYQYLNWPDWFLRDSETLRRICEANCFCAGEEDSRGLLGAVADPIRDYTAEEIKTRRRSWEAGYFAHRAAWDHARDSIGAGETMASKGPINVAGTVQVCPVGHQCRSYKCDWTDEPNCRCQVSNYNSVTAQFDKMGCALIKPSEQHDEPELMLLDGKGNKVGFGKRGLGNERELPCPCNGTYVSFKCCESREGLVWEGSVMKLGEVHPDLRQ